MAVHRNTVQRNKSVLIKTPVLRERNQTTCIATTSFLMQSLVTLSVGLVLPKPPPVERGRCFRATYLPICANGATAVRQQLRHIVVTAELPKASLKVEVLVETQGFGGPQSTAVLVR